MRNVLIATVALGAGLVLAGPAAAQAPATPAGSTEAASDAALMAEGAKVYANQCGRCHNMRSSVERSDSEWKVIVSHMRVRGNLTKSEAEAVRVFLQGTNMDDPPASAPSPASEPATSDAGPRVPAGEVVGLLDRMR